MDKVLRPERLETDPNSSTAAKEWLHWKRTFENFLIVLPQEGLDKFGVLTNFVSPMVFQYIEDCGDYTTAIATLEALFVKPKNEIYARYILATRCQHSGETLDEYLQVLKTLSKDCNFKNATAAQYRDESIRDAFITGLLSNSIRQRLLENKTLDLKTMFDQARSLESAMKSSESYIESQASFNAAVPVPQPVLEVPQSENLDPSSTAASLSESGPSCFFCGKNRHPRSKCPARDAMCLNCRKKGHFAKVCRGKTVTKITASTTQWSPILATVIPPRNSAPLSKSSAVVSINGLQVTALFDSGSSESFIHPNLIKKASLFIQPSSSTVFMATSELVTNATGYCRVNLEYQGRTYENLRLTVLPGLCADLILGLDFQSKHKTVVFNYGGPEPPLSVCGFSTLNIDPPEPFANLTADCYPVATKSRRYSQEDISFINREVERLLKEGIIEPSKSPWRAQVVVTKDENHRKRLAIDYSQTINKFTLLDAFPLPRIDELINEMAQYRVFSTVDLRSAYHQVPLKEEDKPYTAFEAKGCLYQFTRLPFGVTNGVACFQREMIKFVQEESLQATFPYLDNITICGKDQEDHDVNLKAFLEAAERKNITYNNDKSVFSTRCLSILGYRIEEGEIRPDPERFRSLRELPVPHNLKSMNRCLGLFSYYSRWIPAFSDRVKPLSNCKSFPLSQEAIEAFESLKTSIEKAVVIAIDESIPFEVETDASDVALAATLNQNGRPVAFFSRTLQGSELKHAAVEKEAQAIIEAVRHWRHFLTGRHFTLKTDQKSVSYMFDVHHKGKIKNDKIMRWKLELACYSFDIVYRPGKSNIPPDTLSRATCAMVSESLFHLHESLCHPGVTRLYHFVRSKNLPYSLDEIRKITSSCKICSECKPQFYRPERIHLIKATKPFERLNVDFKGPLPSSDKNRYFLHVIDEFSRFPFVFPCPDITAGTIIKCFTALFSLFGMPCYVHSDRGASFMSKELRTFLTEKGVATSRTTAYNPEGNGQVERYNNVIWKAIITCLKSKNLSVKHWQVVLSDALHSVRSLLCTATNETPHERFFGFPRRSSVGSSVPSWLLEPGPVLMKRQVRSSKTDPLVDEVELLQATPHYAHVRYPDGRETTVATKHLVVPRRQEQTYQQSVQSQSDFNFVSVPVATEEHTESKADDSPPIRASNEGPSNLVPDPQPPEPPSIDSVDRNEVQLPRRSTRIRRPVDRLNL